MSLSLSIPAVAPGDGLWRALDRSAASSGGFGRALDPLGAPGGGFWRVLDPSVAPGVFRWPLGPPVSVTRRFEPPPDRFKAGHRGVDLLGAGGAQVRSAGPGVVAFAGMVAGRPVVTVSHPGGLRTTYEPVDAAVPVGTVVAAGTPLGALRAGHAGCPADACLHWGLRAGDVYLDPLSLLHRGRVRLLPF